MGAQKGGAVRVLNQREGQQVDHEPVCAVGDQRAQRVGADEAVQNLGTVFTKGGRAVHAWSYCIWVVHRNTGLPAYRDKGMA